jgi:hypothetical protein
MSSNAAKKGRELLKAARSQATLNATVKNDKESVDKKNILNDNEVNNHNENLKDKDHVILLEDSQNDQEIKDNLNLVDHPNDNKKINSISPVKEVTNNLTSKLAMFNTKNKIADKPIIPKSFPKEIPHTDKSTNGSNKVNLLLNRMNKEKEKMISTNKELYIKETKKDDRISNSIEHRENNEENIERSEPSTFIPAPSKTDQEKLMKRITSAKGIAKGLSQAKGGLTQKTSEKIMGMASMLQNRMMNPVGNNIQEPKKKFILEDEDIQRIDDEKKPENLEKNENCSIHINPNQILGKSLEDIILEKPFNKNIRKITKRDFKLPEEKI